MSSIRQSISNVTASTKANVYFGGKVVSHTLETDEGTRITLGIIFPGSYHFDTDAAEGMEIVAGACEIALDGSEESKRYSAGSVFELPGKSGFTVTVEDDICEYICTFID